MRWFLAFDFALIVVGTVAAFVADRPTPDDVTLEYANAFREIGGALVAGGFVGGMILWFEERREDERFAWEARRDQEAAVRAWRRDIDVRLINLVFTELEANRAVYLKQAESGASARKGNQFGQRWWDQVQENANEINTLINHFLRSIEMGPVFDAWDAASRELFEAVPSRPGPIEPYDAAKEREAVAWAEFVVGVQVYRDRYYPVS